MNSSIKIIIYTLACIFAGSAVADTLSWEMCVQEAAQNNAEIISAKQGLEAARNSVGGARSGFFPQVSGTLNFNRGNTAAEGYGATLSASQNLFTGFQDQAKVKQAKANTLVAQENFEIVKARISADLKTAFATFLHAQKLVKLQEDIIRRRQQNYGLVNLRFKSGRENRGSVLLSLANANQAKLDLLKAKNSIMSAATDLARVVGRGEPPDQVTNDIPLEKLPAAKPDFRALAGAAPETRQSLAQVEASRASLTLARAGFFPTLGLSASTGRQDADWFPEREKWSVGATLTFPLFNGGKDYYSAQSASHNVQAARANLDNIARTKINKLNETYNAYMEAIEKLTVDESFREAASLRAEIARAKYNNGLMSFEDWDLIESDLINREKTVLQSQLAQVQAESAWLQAQGRGVIP